MNQTADARSGPLFNIFDSFIIALSSFFSNLFNITSSKERKIKTNYIIRYRSINSYLLSVPKIMLKNNNERIPDFKPKDFKYSDNGNICFTSSSTDILAVIIFDNDKKVLELTMENFIRE